MIYVEEKWFSRQIDFLRFFLGERDLEIIFWMYRESKFTHLSGITIERGSNIPGHPVTTYDDGTISSRTIRQPLTVELITLVENNRRNVSRNVDSIVLYEPSKHEWLACTIGHEGMCLVNDDAYIEKMQKVGFCATRKTPKHW